MTSTVQPDFTALLNTLNNSGFQKTNPPLYQILRALIQADNQNQSAMNSTAFDGVNVGAALSGDGTSANPLNVLVDGTTISVNGSNQLAASATNQLLSSTISVTGTQAASLNTSPIQIVAAITNKLLVPIFGWSQFSQSTSFHSNSALGQIRYHLDSTTQLNMGVLTSTATPTARYSVCLPTGVGATTYIISTLNPPGTALYLYSNGNNTYTPASSDYQCTVTVWYMLI